MIHIPHTLPCGAVLPNRIAKSALTERLADVNHAPNALHYQLYDTWAKGGAGLMITGNIMVDSTYMEAAGNIVLENADEAQAFQKWTQIGRAHGNHFWAQINHPGRQASIFSTFKPIAPSEVKLKKLGLFAKPRAMKAEEVEEIIEKYVNTAILCKAVGFSGVQIHAAHGYLLSQFLSPRTNQRTDAWGGTLANRARPLLLIAEKCREALGHGFPISVKINSADFQRGGFAEEDALWVIQELEARGIDLLEISGGTYENPNFLTEKYEKKASTRAREAYFLDFAKKVRAKSQLPLMVTGGFRSRAFCEEVLENKELDIVGFGRPFLLDQAFPSGFLNGSLERIHEMDMSQTPAFIRDIAEAGWYDYQIHQLAKGQPLAMKYSPTLGVLRFTQNEFIKGIRNRLVTS
ncbi:MAG: NADH:flavin oxidoreductase/NADH oxidase family protein [Bacteroidota bacterium]